ncbi:MAG: GWxTD domain-containing protein [Ignavibacteria bacterium]|nr:GWxTD domain-containing protein [Ignavibacteria bacterium]
MKILFSFLFFLTQISFLYSQIDGNKFQHSIWINPPQVKENFVLNFNIRHDLLIFNKTVSDTFKANVQVQLEILDEKDFVIDRQIIEVNLSCAAYEQTISKELFYSNKFLLSLPKEMLKAKLSLNDVNRNVELRLPPFNFSLTSEPKMMPIFISEKDVRIIFSDSILTKFSNVYSFDATKNLLVLPYKPTEQKIIVEFENSIFEVERVNGYSSDLSLYNFEKLKLLEGNYFLKFNSNTKEKIPFKVVWFNKPEYLKNISASVRLAEFIFEKDFTKEITSYSDEAKYIELFQAWKKFDPTPNTPFNELMAEFYHRADFATVTFKSLQIQDGALSDRGKIYLLYGTPKTNERSFSQDGKAIEIWKYEGQINHQFIFVDDDRSGNFKIKK